MIEKVNPNVLDKKADRIAGAIIDLAYKTLEEPNISTEVMLSGDDCNIVIISNIDFNYDDIDSIVHRIAGENYTLNLYNYNNIIEPYYKMEDLSIDQNGIYEADPLNDEKKEISAIAKNIFEAYPEPGSYILDNHRFIITQPDTRAADLWDLYPEAEVSIIPQIDNIIGCSNRRLNSDLLNNVTTGSFHGRDIFKSSVAIPIYLFVSSIEADTNIRLSVQAGDTYVNMVPYAEIV